MRVTWLILCRLTSFEVRYAPPPKKKRIILYNEFRSKLLCTTPVNCNLFVSQPTANNDANEMLDVLLHSSCLQIRTFYNSTPHSFLLNSASPSGCSKSSVCFCTHKLQTLSVGMMQHNNYTDRACLNGSCYSKLEI
jgi:hypothetical protein